jgi:thymidylate synthase (FAD)|tara:strand:- start:3047 stop:3748 length:702 start_codon:yes stop_codon:yes gene_type:complete
MKNKKIEIYDDGIGAVELVDFMGDDLTIVNAARVSFGRTKESLNAKDEKLIKYLVKNRHTSTLEHNVVTFKFTVPLFVRSQHHRHRTWSYNEISRRYTEENLQFYEPSTFRTQHISNRQASDAEAEINPELERYFYMLASNKIKVHHVACTSLYETLLDSGVCREQARGVLPQSLYTEYYGTANLNNILKFVDLRVDSHAQWEIQKVGEAVLEITSDLFPVAVRAWKERMQQK